MIPHGLAVQMGAKRLYSSCAAEAASNGNDADEYCTRMSSGEHDQSVPEEAEARKKIRKLNPQVEKKKKQAHVVMGGWGRVAFLHLILFCYFFTVEEVILNRITCAASVMAICAYQLEWTRKSRLEQFQQLRSCAEFVAREEYCPLCTLVDEDAQCWTFGFCLRTRKWVPLNLIPRSTDRVTALLPVASTPSGLLLYTQYGNASQEILLVNPLTKEGKILGLGNGSTVEEDSIGRNHDQNGDPYADEDESEEEEDYGFHGQKSYEIPLIHILQEPGTEVMQIIMTGRELSSAELASRGVEKGEQVTEVYDSRTDTWTTSGKLCDGMRLAKYSSNAYYQGLVLTVGLYEPMSSGVDNCEDRGAAAYPYFLLAYNVGLREWSVYTRIVVPGSFVNHEHPQIVGCDGGIFLVTLFVCPTIQRAPGANEEDDDDERTPSAFSHQVVIYKFMPSTLGFARITATFTYISVEPFRDLCKCVGGNGKICIGLTDRALGYYDVRQDKWHKYPELCLDSDSEEDDDDEELRYAGVSYRPNLTTRVH
ncbi:unnamed protein product [Sphagnum jensenii]|uniref:Uncharacterized protein n=1 Tax=Sphagnum jensenii TaxID=128206 RepID=A0ABP0WGC3_9BRYO